MDYSEYFIIHREHFTPFWMVLLHVNRRPSPTHRIRLAFGLFWLDSYMSSHPPFLLQDGRYSWHSSLLQSCRFVSLVFITLMLLKDACSRREVVVSSSFVVRRLSFVAGTGRVGDPCRRAQEPGKRKSWMEVLHLILLTRDLLP